MVCVFVFVCLWGSTFAGLAFCATLHVHDKIDNNNNNNNNYPKPFRFISVSIPGFALRALYYL